MCLWKSVFPHDVPPLPAQWPCAQVQDERSSTCESNVRHLAIQSTLDLPSQNAHENDPCMHSKHVIQGLANVDNVLRVWKSFPSNATRKVYYPESPKGFLLPERVSVAPFPVSPVLRFYQRRQSASWHDSMTSFRHSLGPTTLPWISLPLTETPVLTKRVPQRWTIRHTSFQLRRCRDDLSSCETPFLVLEGSLNEPRCQLEMTNEVCGTTLTQ